MVSNDGYVRPSYLGGNNMEQFNFHEVVIGILVGDVAEGDTFTTTSGFKAVYKDGVLSWVTQGGYVGSPVAVTAEVLDEVFYMETKFEMAEVDFKDALDFIKMGTEVLFVIEGREYTVDSFEELDELISSKEYFEDVYNAGIYVEITQEEKAIAEQILLQVNESEPHVLTPDEIRYIEQDLVPSILKELEELGEESRVAGKKLSFGEAYNIHHQYHFVKRSVAEIAEGYGVSSRMIYYVLDGTHWADAYKVFHEDYDIVQEDYIK
jgi:hypothetical protein